MAFVITKYCSMVDTSIGVLFVLPTMCSAYAERDVPFERDVSFGSDVRFARENTEHITSLCAKGAILHYAVRHNFTAACRNFTNY